jgi:hypothetical protein
VALTTYDKAAVSGAQGFYRVHVEILAPRSSMPSERYWCDINKPSPSTGGALPYDYFWDRLVSEPTITTKTEIVPGRFTWTISELVLDDEDGAFGRPCTETNPWYMQACYVSGGITCKLTSWVNAIVRVRISERLTDPTTDTYHALGLYTIKDIARSTQRVADPRRPGTLIRVARVKLATPSETLEGVSAREVRRGDTWICNAPLTGIVSELIERSSKGAFEAASTLPVSIKPTSETDRALSVLGNVPIRQADGTWNESREFIPRHVFESGDNLYFAGYSALDNCPMVVSWNRATDAWTSSKQTDDPGWEAAFCCVSGSYVYLACVSNVTGFQTGFAENYRNLACRIYRTGTTLGTWTAMSHASCKPVWRMGQVPVYATSSGLVWYFGRYTDHSATKYDFPVFFPSTPWAAGFEEWGYSPTWRCQQDESEDYYPSKRDKYTSLFAITDTHRALLTDTFQAGYCGGKTTNQGTNGDELPVGSYVHGSIHESFKYAASRNKIYWFYFDGSANNWYLASFDLAGETHSTQQVLFGGAYDGNRLCFFENNVTAFEVYSSGTTHRLWVGAVKIEVSTGVTGSHNPEALRLYYKDAFPTPTTTVQTFTSLHSNFTSAQRTRSEANYYCPFLCSIRSSNSGAAVSGCVANYMAAAAVSYGLWYYVTSTYNGIFAPSAVNVQFPRSTLPFEIVTNERSGSLYALDQASGQMWLMQPAVMWQPVGAPSFISYGDTIDDENTWASSNIIWSSGYSRLYGVSASESPADTRVPVRSVNMWAGGAPGLGLASPTGRVSLWQWSYEVSDVVRVADFGDENAWNALEMCRLWAGDYIMGFSRDVGTDTATSRKPAVYFKQRSTATPTITIIEENEGVNPGNGTIITCERLETYLDTANIANQITIPVYKGQHAAPECAVTLSGYAEDRQTGNVSASQTSNAAQTVVLQCVTNGVPQSGTYDGSTTPMLFSWSLTRADVVTGLAAAAAPTDTTIRPRGLYSDRGGLPRIGDVQIREGDFCKVGNGNLCTITTGGINPAAGTIQVNPAIGGNATHKVGATVTITPKTAVRFSNSSAGICTVTADFTVPTTTAISSLAVDDTSNIAAGMVLYRDTGLIEVVSVASANELRVRGDVIGSGVGQVSTWPTGTILSGYLWFKIPGRAYQVGGTGIAVAISPRSGENYRQGEWRSGDTIRIVSKGLTAAVDPTTVVSSSDPASVERWGAKSWRPRVECRLMTSLRARILLEDAPQMATPAWVTTATNCPLLSGVDVGDVFYCQSSHLWGATDALLGIVAGNKVAHEVTGITRTLAYGAPRMTLNLRSYIVGGSEGDARDYGVGGGGYPKTVHTDKTTEEE